MQRREDERMGSPSAPSERAEKKIRKVLTVVTSAIRFKKTSEAAPDERVRPHLPRADSHRSVVSALSTASGRAQKKAKKLLRRISSRRKTASGEGPSRLRRKNSFRSAASADIAPPLGREKETADGSDYLPREIGPNDVDGNCDLLDSLEIVSLASAPQQGHERLYSAESAENARGSRRRVTFSYGDTTSVRDAMAGLAGNLRTHRRLTSVCLEQLSMSVSYTNLVQQERWMDWASSFRRTDPRYQILRFFNDVAQEGAEKIAECGLRPELISPLLKVFVKASVFTVWRPTSIDAIRKMMMREGTGKGLDIKGKSAKKGMLSGYVPFLQIHEEHHKTKIRTLQRDGRIRIFFGSPEMRNEAAQILGVVSQEMVSAVATAKAVLSSPTTDDYVLKEATQTIMWDMDDPSITYVDDYSKSNCFGIEIAERLFWEGYVMRQDISRDPLSKHCTGRPSEPSFQDMNFASASIRHQEEEGMRQKGSRRAVVWQLPEADHVMCPKSLLMAYGENDRVLPVVSDFDCFIMGTRGVRYDSPLPPDQLEVMKWCVSQTKTILDSPATEESWTQRWLDVLKQSAVKGFHPNVPEFGFSDPKSYSIMEHAVGRMRQSGAVRHGAECFNYYFPQEVDDHFLVISETLGPPGSVPWKYVNVQELQDILCKRIDEGFTFPLNPKWVMCDPGWKRVYDKLLESNRPNVQKSMACWYPPESGLREIIERVHLQHPHGFQRDTRGDLSCIDGTSAMDLAELELKYYLALQRAKKKVRALIVWRKLCAESGLMNQSHIRSSATNSGET